MADAILGPTGGHGGTEFQDYAAPAGAKIVAIHVYAYGFVDAIQVVCKGADGEPVSLSRIGGHSGLDHAFVLDDDEYLTGISGRSGVYLDSIRFHTNKRTSDTFGGHGGENEYRFDAAANAEVAGFFGRSGWFIDALGIVTRERVTAPAAAGEAPAKKATKPRAKATGKDAAVAPVATPPIAAPVAAAVVEAVAPAKPKATRAKAAGKGAEVAPAAVPAVAAPVAAAVVEAAAPAKPKATRAKAAGKGAEVAPAAAPEAPAPVAAAAVEAVAPPAKPKATRAAKTPVLTTTTAGPDELEKIEGIGPKIAAVLVENGIGNFAELAATPVERLREILQGAGSRYRMADPTTWPQQAALGASGDWAALDKLQSELRAGRKQ
jgi:predicted flap endonuclease-1-like 5' DNA nuclease